MTPDPTPAPATEPTTEPTTESTTESTTEPTTESIDKTLPTDAERFWRPILGERSALPAKRADGTPTALARRLGPFPGWRGAEDLLIVLEDIYEKAAETAQARLDGEIE